MKLGGFGLLKDYEKIAAAGYDFAELDVPEIEALEEREFEKLCETLRAGRIPVLTGARLFPISEPLFFTEGFVPEKLAPYLERACRRTKALGIQKVILGNGKARSLLTAEDRKKEEVFLQLLRMTAKIAGANGQELILEPLGPKYSNYINTIPEAVNLIEKTGMKNIFTMADLRHMYWSEEPFSDLIDYVFYIHHIHIDYPLSYPERNYPESADDYDYSAFLKTLKKSGYHDTLTVEADIPTDWAEAYGKAWEVLESLL